MSTQSSKRSGANNSSSKEEEFALTKQHWTKTDHSDFSKFLNTLGDSRYREFNKKVTATQRQMIGIRVPILRAMSKNILKGNFEEFLQFPPDTYEDVLLRGFVIGGLPYQTMLQHFDSFLPLMDSWGISDTFCATLKSIKKNQDDFYTQKLQALLSPTAPEYFLRLGVVILLNYYVDSAHISLVFDMLNSDSAQRNEYYVAIAVAWLVAECLAKFSTVSLQWFRRNTLPVWTHNKAISKACESNSVTAAMKQKLRALRRVEKE